ncbi:MAG: hypothetical protein AAGA66_16190 [Bacteroidota bacterium]
MHSRFNHKRRIPTSILRNIPEDAEGGVEIRKFSLGASIGTRNKIYFDWLLYDVGISMGYALFYKVETIENDDDLTAAGNELGIRPSPFDLFIKMQIGVRL